MNRYANILTMHKKTFRRRATKPYDQPFRIRQPTSPTSDILSTTNPQTSQQDTPHFVNTDDDDIDHVVCDSDSSSDDQSDRPDYPEFKSSLRDLVLLHEPKQNFVTAMLKLLKANGHPELPSDCRTLLETPKTRDTVDLPPGKYCHVGLFKGLRSYAKNCQQVPSEMTLDVNVDGVPISISSASHFWLVLGRIVSPNCPIKIFVIGIYHGYKKPKCFADFLTPFINEAKELATFSYNGIPINVNLRCIICDAPARNSCLGTKGHSGYYGCGRCVQKGVRVNRRTTFPEISSEKRTDDNFRRQDFPEHHHVESPFLQLPNFDIVAQFPLDYLHTLCLGVTRKLLYAWMDDRSILTKNDIELISKRLNIVNKSQPSDFQRKCRPLDEISYYKGCEFRNLLLYILPVVMKGILPIDHYAHFLFLNIATIILIDSNLCKTHLDIAQGMLETFVSSLGEIYGPEILVYNMHSLVHIVDDVKLYGNLDNYSAFAFESFMYKIKKMLHKSNQPLAQISNRIEEKYNGEKPYEPLKTKKQFLRKNRDESGNVIYQELVTPKFVLNFHAQDKWFMTDKEDIFEFKHCCRISKTITARKVETKSEFFDTPVSSASLQIYHTHDVALSEEVSVQITSIKSKLFAMPLDDGLVFAPLRHTT